MSQRESITKMVNQIIKTVDPFTKNEKNVMLLKSESLRFIEIDDQEFPKNDSFYAILNGTRLYISKKSFVNLIARFLLNRPEGNIIIKNSEKLEKNLCIMNEFLE